MRQRVRRASGAIPKAVIVPHAGYVYSGPIAAAAYARLASGRRTIRRVVLLGPTHRVPVRGPRVADCAGVRHAARRRRDRSQGGGSRADVAAGPGERCRACARAFAGSAAAVPAGGLGRVPDRAVRRRRRDGRRGRRRHRSAVGRAGDADRRELRSVALSPLCGSPRHRPRNRRRDPRARAGDRSRAGLRRDAGQWAPACARAVAGSRPELLDLRNSGDTAGDKSRVVGYASFAFAQGNGRMARSC